MDDARLMRLSRLRVMIEEEGLCNVIAEIGNALQMNQEENEVQSYYEYSEIEKINNYELYIVDMFMGAVDISHDKPSQPQIIEKLISIKRSIDNQLEKHGG